MKKLLVLTCCVGLVSLAGGAQQNDQNNNQKKKKGGGNAPQQQVVTQPTGKKYKTGKGGGYNAQTVQQPGTVTSNTGKKGKKGNKASGQGPVTGQPTQPNVNGGNAANTNFNKTKYKKGNMANAAGGGGAMKYQNTKKYQKQHFNLQTNKTVYKYKTVNYNSNYKIAGAYRWGPRYAVFANYHPAWHDTWWWNSHYGANLVFIYGGWYYWNANYWYPAWGYAPNSAYYFDGPIYSSNPTYDPAQVVANVQSALQDQGYYQGDIDGILGPQTRAAIAEYQSAQGLEPTGVVDEPTLQTLGMA